MMKKIILITLSIFIALSGVSFAQQSTLFLDDEDESMYRWSEDLLRTIAAEANLNMPTTFSTTGIPQDKEYINPVESIQINTIPASGSTYDITKYFPLVNGDAWMRGVSFF